MRKPNHIFWPGERTTRAVSALKTADLFRTFHFHQYCREATTVYSSFDEEIPAPPMLHEKSGSSRRTNSLTREEQILKPTAEKIKGATLQTDNGDYHGSHKEQTLQIDNDRLKRLERNILIIKAEQKQMLELLEAFMSNRPEREEHEGEDIDVNFPVKTVEELNALEEKIKSDKMFKNRLLKRFQLLGGNTVEDAIRWLLRRVFNNSLASTYSWQGQRGKRALEELNVIQVIFCAVSTQKNLRNVTQKEMENATKEWFRHAPARVKKELSEI